MKGKCEQCGKRGHLYPCGIYPHPWMYLCRKHAIAFLKEYPNAECPEISREYIEGLKDGEKKVKNEIYYAVLERSTKPEYDVRR